MARSNKKICRWLVPKPRKHKNIHKIWMRSLIHHKKECVDYIYDLDLNQNGYNRVNQEPIAIPTSLQSLLCDNEKNMHQRSHRKAIAAKARIAGRDKRESENKNIVEESNGDDDTFETDGVDQKSIGTPVRWPSTPLQMSLRNGKIPLRTMTGFGMMDMQFVSGFVELLSELSEKAANDTDFRRCICDKPRLNGYNNKSSVLTEECDICCKCGQKYGTFVFGSKVKIDGQKLYENGMRFAAMTQHLKIRYQLGVK